MSGKWIASCGHELDDMGVSVEFESETCDPVYGFEPCTVYATYCPACADNLLKTDPSAKAEPWSIP